MARMKTPDGRPYGERPQEVDGIAVIQRQRALSPHPNPSQNGRLVETRGVTQLLLDDGREVFECDTCLKTYDNPRSVTSHLPSHNPSKGDPEYPVDVIRKILRMCAVERRAGIRDYCVRVADQLNADGKIKPLHAEVWTPNVISRMYARYHTKYAVRVRQARVVNPAEVTPTTRRTRATGDRARIANLFNEATERIAAARSEIRLVETALTDIMREVDRIPAEQKIDPVILQKAAKYDEFIGKFRLD